MKHSPDGDARVRFERMYGRLVLSWLIEQDVDRRDAEDTCKEVVATAVASIGEHDRDGLPGGFGCRLRRIMADQLQQQQQQQQQQQSCGRKSSDQHKDASVSLSAIADQLSDDRSRMSRAWDRRHDAFVLHEMLDHLNERFSERSMTAFRRVAVGQEDASKVADELGLSLGALRVAQHRVLRALREAALGMVDETA